ncbi:hypothetical protein [Polaromonas naphthalenivorans]|uniref:Uncharacterized protein n=1 Tax=Polaromonas naphthalenivorans (strain CJ2) TaxID=365044 RepID=A1VIK6_POLNA|nr:hypothetical protein [Polaromonas naphthalenivorans]ABM35484.1 hypothetical protein Pnap_0159 [Polaromonas naphthalenivorans CJ2]MBH2010434.1 hypothetical protein [Xanthomonadaceae bacterium]
MSAPWFSKPLGDGVWAYSLSNQARDAFEPLFVLAGRPLEMAVFTRHQSAGRLHCEVTAYFSPAAATVAHVLDARPCGAPSRGNLDLLAGDPACWPVIFPDGE